MGESRAAGPPLTPAAGTIRGVRLRITGRACGNMSLRVGGGDPLTARATALAGVGRSLDDAVFAAQVHAARVARVGERERGAGAREPDSALADVDALVTTQAGVALCIQVADCVPVGLVATDAAGVATGTGVVHAGRGGVAAGVVGAAVAALADAASAGPEAISAVIGPGIGGCCYEVPAELGLEVTTAAPRARVRTRWGTPGLDLPAAVGEQLAAAGVGRVESAGSCTRCAPDRWYSHRAAQAGEATPGRQMMVAALDAPTAMDPEASLDFGP